MKLKNRLFMAPFTPMQDDTESDKGIAYYEERAKSRIGLYITL